MKKQGFSVLPDDPPACLQGMPDAQDHWRYIMRIAEQLELCVSDVPVMVSACQWWEAMQVNMREMVRDGAVVDYDNGTRAVSPALTAAKRATDEWLSCASKLGMTPESRHRRKVSVRPRKSPTGANAPGARFAR